LGNASLRASRARSFREPRYYYLIISVVGRQGSSGHFPVKKQSESQTPRVDKDGKLQISKVYWYGTLGLILRLYYLVCCNNRDVQHQTVPIAKLQRQSLFRVE